MTDSSQADGRLLPANNWPTDFTVQVLQGDRRLAAGFEGPQHVPLVLTRKLQWHDCADFFATDRMMTFTAPVPLAVVTLGAAAMVKHIQETAFDFTVYLSDCDFRPVGAQLGAFAAEMSGDVLLQVICSVNVDP